MGAAARGGSRGSRGSRGSQGSRGVSWGSGGGERTNDEDPFSLGPSRMSGDSNASMSPSGGASGGASKLRLAASMSPAGKAAVYMGARGERGERGEGEEASRSDRADTLP